MWPIPELILPYSHTSLHSCQDQSSPPHYMDKVDSWGTRNTPGHTGNSQSPQILAYRHSPRASGPPTPGCRPPHRCRLSPPTLRSYTDGTVDRSCEVRQMDGSSLADISHNLFLLWNPESEENQIRNVTKTDKSDKKMIKSVKKFN